MGPGLPTAKSIIYKHRGRLSVESGVGKGTTSVILLPIRRAASQNVIIESATRVLNGYSDPQERNVSIISS